MGGNGDNGATGGAEAQQGGHKGDRKTIENISSMKMVVARAAGTVMASSLNQNKFWTKYCCDGGIKPAPSPLGLWRKNDTIIRCLDGIFIEIFCVWGNGLDPSPISNSAPGEEVQQ